MRPGKGKLPARPVLERYEAQVALDQQAIEAIGEPFEVPRFCAEMGRLLKDSAEEGKADQAELVSPRG